MSLADALCVPEEDPMPEISPVEQWIFSEFGLFSTGEDGCASYTQVTGWLDEQEVEDSQDRGMFRLFFDSITRGRSRARAEHHEKMMSTNDKGGDGS